MQRLGMSTVCSVLVLINFKAYCLLLKHKVLMMQNKVYLSRSIQVIENETIQRVKKISIPYLD